MRVTIPLILALAAAGATAASATTRQRPIGQETTIPFASHHGLRSWAEGADENEFYVQDYRNDWYKVELSGPCVGNMASLRIAYTTGPGGAFDRFSRVFSTDFPEMTCSVMSIKTSLPPPGHEKKAKKKPS
ncbi:MAG: DUF6491 family protein [Sphingomonas sp.]